MMNNDLHHVVTAIAFALLHSLWEVSVLGLFAALSFTLMRRAAAWQRHTVGLVWMLAMVAAPLLTCVRFLQSAVAGYGAPAGIAGAFLDRLGTAWRDAHLAGGRGRDAGASVGRLAVLAQHRQPRTCCPAR